MKYTAAQQEEHKKTREQADLLRDEMLQLIHPNREYMCHFLEYYPDFNTKENKARIRAFWNGVTCSQDILIMLENVVKKLKAKYKNEV